MRLLVILSLFTFSSCRGEVPVLKIGNCYELGNNFFQLKKIYPHSLELKAIAISINEKYIHLGSTYFINIGIFTHIKESGCYGID